MHAKAEEANAGLDHEWPRKAVRIEVGDVDAQLECLRRIAHFGGQPQSMLANQCALGRNPCECLRTDILDQTVNRVPAFSVIIDRDPGWPGIVAANIT